MRVAGIVLCGGQSSRMGRPKAWLPFAGELMLPRVVRILNEVVSPIVVVAAPDQDVPPLPAGIQIVRDEAKGRGPLQGLHAGLGALRGNADAAYLSSCDVPFLQPAFVRRLIDLLGDHAISVPRVGEYYHPLAAVYRLEVADAVARLLAENRLRPFFLFEAARTRVVEASELADVDPTFQTLRNLNTPEEYEAALRECAARLDVVGNVKIGMSREQVVAVLGPPDDVGGTSRRHRTPSVYKYGDIELFFGHSKLGKLWMAYKEVQTDDGEWHSVVLLE
jgi:molybdopterin-guanine dinucleotide biosynthesis protein A